MTVFTVHSSRRGAIRTNARGPTAQLDFATTIETSEERAVRYVYDVDLPSGDYKIEKSITGDLVLDIPSIVFPVGDIQPVHVTQTLTTTTQGRPVMNKGIVREICQIVAGDDDVSPDRPLFVFISPLRSLNGAMVVSEEHEQAAELFDAYKNILARRNGAPVIMRAKMLDGKGHFTRTKWAMTKSMFQVITGNLISTSRFFKPAKSKTAKSKTPAAADAIDAIDDAIDIDIDIDTADDAADEAIDANTDDANDANDANTKFGEAFDEFQRAFTVSSISEDTVSDSHDTMFAMTALSLIRANAPEEKFDTMVDKIRAYIDAAVADDPTMADRPAQLAAQYVTKITPRLPQCIVAPLNCLADMM